MMAELFTIAMPPIEAILVILISVVLFIPALCVVKMFEEMIKITTGAYSNDERSRK